MGKNGVKEIKILTKRQILLEKLVEEFINERYSQSNESLIQEMITGELNIKSVLTYVPIETNALKNFKNLEQLKLSSIDLPCLNSQEFSGLISLKRLHIQDFGLRLENETNIFQGLANLEKLVIEFSLNLITCIKANTFIGLTNLKILELTHNNITQIETQELSNLTKLDLSFNEITNIEKHTFLGLIKLESLFIEGNKSIRCDSTSFECLINLKFLKLCICNLETIDVNSFNKPNKLKVEYSDQLSSLDYDVHIYSSCVGEFGRDFFKNCF